MFKFILLLFFPVLCFGQEINGKWRANYTSANGDGAFTECVIFLSNTNRIEALRWTIAECWTCKSLADRKPRIVEFPLKISESNINLLLRKIEFKLINGNLVEEDASPIGEDVVYKKDLTYLIKPSFNCVYAKQEREKAICSSSTLSLLDLELSLVFERAKQCTSKTSIEKTQNDWWKNDLSKCQTADCVPKVYSERMAELRKVCKS